MASRGHPGPRLRGSSELRVTPPPDRRPARGTPACSGFCWTLDMSRHVLHKTRPMGLPVPWAGCVCPWRRRPRSHVSNALFLQGEGDAGCRDGAECPRGPGVVPEPASQGSLLLARRPVRPAAWPRTRLCTEQSRSRGSKIVHAAPTWDTGARPQGRVGEVAFMCSVATTGPGQPSA